MKKLLLPILLSCLAVLHAGEIIPANAKTVVQDGFARTIKPAELFCSIPFKINEQVTKDLALVFEYKVSAAKNCYMAVNLQDTTKRMTYSQLPLSREWKEAVLPLTEIHYADKQREKLPIGTALKAVTIYAKHTGPKDAAGEIRLDLRKVRFENRRPVKNAEAAAVKAPPFKLPYNVSEQNWTKNTQKTKAEFRDNVFSVTSKEFNAFTSLGFELNMPFQSDVVCDFEYRVKKNGANISYVAVNFMRKGKNNTFHQFPVNEEWRNATIPFDKLSKDIPKGEIIPRMAIYAKASSGTPTLEVRNLRFTRNPNYDPLASVRVSYSAYPLMDWTPQKGAAGYRVAYNGQTAEVKDAFFVPAKPLPPGLVKYTVTALPSGDVVAEDQLIIPERNLQWKLPEFDFKAFAAKPHPRYRKLAENFWIPLPPVVRNMALLCAQEPAPADPAPYKEGADPNIRSWIEWYGKVADGVTSKFGNRMHALGRETILTGDPELKKAARLRLLEAIKWDPDGGSSMRRGDLQAAWLLRGICWCYDAAYDILSPEERKAAAACIRKRGDQFFHASFPFRGAEAQNHSWDKMEAAAFAALTLAEEPDMEMRYRFAAALFAYRFFPSLGFDGENNEGLMYWSYGLGLAIRFVDVARYTLGINYYEQPWLKQTARFPMYCQPPRGISISFADNGKPNHSRTGPMSPLFTAKLAADGADPQALWYAGYAEKNGTQARTPLTLPQSRTYPHIGWTLFNTFLPDGRENVAVGFHSGKYFAGHQHADQNNFVINAYGDKLAVDGGYYDWWGSKHFMQYSVQTVAHNTILADGKGQDWMVYGSDGETRNYFDAPNFGFVSGDARKVYQRRVSQFDRDLLFVKPDYVFVFDRLAAPKPTSFSWLMHSHTDEPIAHTGTDFAIDRPLAGLTGSVLLPRDAQVKVAPAYTVMPVNGYSVDPVPNRQKEWCFTAETLKPVEKTEFLAAMRISRGPGAKVEKIWNLEENADALLIKGTDTAVLFNRNPGKVVELGNFKTDARCAAVILSGSKVIDWVKIDGTSLIYAGEKLSTAAGSQAGITQNMQKKADTVEFCGKNVPVTRYAIPFALGKAVYSAEGILNVTEAGEYTLEVSTPAHCIVAQSRDRYTAEKVGPANPVKVTLEPGKFILCVSADQPIGKIVLKK